MNNLIVNTTPEHKGALYHAGPLPHGAKMVGTVSRGDTARLNNTGALVLLVCGQYVQLNAGILRSLDQVAVRKAL